MNVALVHDWLLTIGGAERVLEQLAFLYPDAPIYSVLVDPAVLPPSLTSHHHIQTWIRHLPLSRRLYKRYLPLMPWAIEDLDLSSYDLVLSDCSAVSKGVVTRADTVHISYIHTPMRYAWDLYHEYRHREVGRFTGAVMGPLFSYIRQWDYLAAQRPDVLVANSLAVKRRIAKHYRRDSMVIPPPVDVDRFVVAEGPGDYYLALSRLVPYKRLDIAVEACSRLKLPLVVAGDGPERGRLERMAGPTVRFVGHVTDAEVAHLLRDCRALLFPGEEDFGIVVVEAGACGRPVVAYGRGGALDTVIPEETGLLFYDQSVEALVNALQQEPKISWNREMIRQNAERFRPDNFRTAYQAVVDQALHDYHPSSLRLGI